MKDFIEKWKSKSLGFEKQDCQIFWIGLARVCCDVENSDDVLKFEVPVNLPNSKGYIDVWIPATRIIIEQKSRGKSLDKPEKQSDGAILNAFGQAKRYDNARAVDQKANWIITSNFDEIWIYNMRFGRPERHVLKIPLEELPNQDLRFLTNPKLAEIKSEEQISTAAGMIVQDFRDLFLTTKLNDDELLALNRLCVRLVFCLYAEDAGGFKKRQFLDFLLDLRKIGSLENFRLTLAQLFVTLSTKEEDREFMTSHIFRAFSYVDGELFKDDPTKAMGMLEFFERLDGKFDLREVVRALIDASENFNWSKISPTIFGSIFESILNPETKRADGIHFTSVANIHKAIDPLILDELNEEFDQCRSIEDFERLHDKIASLKFFDPACGSGNFLTETFISLRKLENRILEKICGDIKVTIKNFYGIEINDFLVSM